MFENKAYHANFQGDQPKISLLMAFYNNVPFFEKVFASIEAQAFQAFELIICDDGSNAEAVEKVKTICASSSVAVKHIWHSDRGFCKNEALNRGILQSRAEYLVFLDADCVLHPLFLFDHWSERKSGHTLAGRRVNLTAVLSKMLTLDRIKTNFLQKNWWWIFVVISWMKDNNGIKGFRVTNEFLYKFLNARKHRGLLGCNFSVHKADLVSVNGFDMNYNRPGIGEDSDIDFRLSGIGVTPIPLTFKAVQYHLYHRLLPRSDANEAKFNEVMRSKKYITDFGLKQLEG